VETSDLKIPAMTPTEVHDFLREIGSHWTGQGCAVELGCWLGATSVPLLEGLITAGYNKSYWAFDRWRASEAEVEKARLQGQQLVVGQDLMHIYVKNVTPVYDDIIAVRGDLPQILEKFTPQSIEFIIFDAPKRNPVFARCMRALLPYFIPGVTVVALLDYYAYRKNTGAVYERLKAPVYFIENNIDSFSMIRNWPELCSCAFFKYIKPCRGQ